MSGEMAPALDGIKVVADATTRDAAIPLLTRPQDARVFNKATGNVERWSGSAWVTDLTGSGGVVGTYNALTYGATGNGTTDDRGALNGLANATIPGTGGILLLPAGTYRVSSALTIPSTVTLAFSPGAKLTIDTGITVTIVGTLLNPGRVQIFTGAGTVSFRNASVGSFATSLDAVFPEWWGAVPGAGTSASVDCGPAIQKAVRSGARRILLTEGIYEIATQVVIDAAAASDIVIEGISRSGSYLATQVASYGATNAMFVNQQDNGKLSFRRLRFAGSTDATIPIFTGTALYAAENGATSQAIFSGVIEDCWIGMGYGSAQFFYGALNNYQVRGNVFELGTTCFVLLGAGAATGDVHFDDNILWNSFDSFLDLSQDTSLKNIISVRGLNCYQPQRGFLIKANNVQSLSLSDIDYQLSDPVAGANLGVLSAVNCANLHVNRVTAIRYPGSTANMDVVFALQDCDGIVSDVLVDGGANALTMAGACDLTFTGVTFKNQSSHAIHPGAIAGGTAVLSGTLRFKGLSVLRPNATCWQEAAANTYSAAFEGCDMLDAGYNGAGVYAFDVATTGAVRWNGGQIGKTNVLSAMSCSVRATGTGTVTIENVEQRGVIPFLDVGSSQVVKVGRVLNVSSVFYGTAIPLGATWQVGDSVINSAPASAGIEKWVCTVAGTNGTLVGTTGGITTGTKTLVVNTATGLSIGQSITIAGVAGIKVIANIVGTTVTIDTNAGATVVAAAVAYSPATFVATGVVGQIIAAALADIGALVTTDTAGATYTAAEQTMLGHIKTDLATIRTAVNTLLANRRTAKEQS